MKSSHLFSLAWLLPIWCQLKLTTSILLFFKFLVHVVGCGLWMSLCSWTVPWCLPTGTMSMFRSPQAISPTDDSCPRSSFQKAAEGPSLTQRWPTASTYTCCPARVSPRPRGPCVWGQRSSSRVLPMTWLSSPGIALALAPTSHGTFLPMCTQVPPLVGEGHGRAPQSWAPTPSLS